MATIGSLVLKIAANAQPMLGTLRKAEDGIRGFAAKAGSFLKTGLVAAAAAAAAGIAAIGTAATVAAIKIKGWYDEQAPVIDSAGKFASRLGIATDVLMGWEVAAARAGVAAADLRGALAQLDKKIGLDVAGMSKEASIALDKLGLKLEDVAFMDPERRFRLLIRKLNEVGPAAMQGILPKLFEEQGNKLTNFIAMGIEAIEKYEQAAKRWGRAVNDVNYEKVAGALDAAADLEDMWTGFKMTLTAELAPVIRTFAETFVNKFGSMREAAKQLGNVIITLVEKLMAAVEWLAEFGKQNFVEPESLRRWADVLSIIPGQMLQAQRMRAMASGMEIAGQIGENNPLRQLLDFVKGGVAEAREKLNELTREPTPEELAAKKAEVALKRATEREAWLLKLRADAWRTFHDKLAETAKKITEEMRTPEEIYKAETERLRVLQVMGLLDKETLRRAFKKAKKDLADAKKVTVTTSPELAPGATRGSAEAVRAEQRHFAGAARNQIGWKDLVEEQRKGNEIANKGIARMDKMVEQMKNIKPIKIVAWPVVGS